MITWKKIYLNEQKSIYSISDTGEVLNDKTGRILKQRSSNEYKRVSLTILQKYVEAIVKLPAIINGDMSIQILKIYQL